MSSSDGSRRSTAGDQRRRARSAGIALTNQSASIVRRRPRRSVTRADSTLPPFILERLDRVADVEAHAEPAQHLHPRIDPGLVRRRVQDPVGRAVVAAALDVVDERLAHVPDGAGGRLALLGRHDRTGQAAGEDLLVLVRLVLGLDEVPPAHVLPLAVPALVARGDEDHEPLDEVRKLVGRKRVLVEGVEEQPPHAVRRAGLVGVGRDPEDRPVGASLGARRLRLASLPRGCPTRRSGCRGTGSGASSRERGGRSRGRSGTRAHPAAACARRRPCRPPGCCAPCRRAPCARRRPPGSRARPARGRPRGRPSRLPARPRACRGPGGGRPPGCARSPTRASLPLRRPPLLPSVPPAVTAPCPYERYGAPFLAKGLQF